MNSAETLQDTFKNKRELFSSTLESFVILDIGVIEKVHGDGKARVVSSTFVYNKPVVYERAEIIFPGNPNGCYSSECINMPCLIFIPRSCMIDTNSLKLSMGAQAYSKDGVKALPIGNSIANNVKTYFGDGGDFSIIGQTYKVLFTGGDVTLQTNDGATSLVLGGQGQLYLLRQTDNGSLTINIEDGTVEKQWLSKDKDVLWTDTLNEDGSRSFVQSDPEDEEADPLFSITIDKDGTASITMAQDLTLETKGTLALKGGNVTIDSTDDDSTVSINGTNLVVDK